MDQKRRENFERADSFLKDFEELLEKHKISIGINNEKVHFFDAEKFNVIFCFSLERDQSLTKDRIVFAQEFHKLDFEFCKQVESKLIDSEHKEDFYDLFGYMVFAQITLNRLRIIKTGIHVEILLKETKEFLEEFPHVSLIINNLLSDYEGKKEVVDLINKYSTLLNNYKNEINTHFQLQSLVIPISDEEEEDDDDDEFEI